MDLEDECCKKKDDGFHEDECLKRSVLLVLLRCTERCKWKTMNSQDYEHILCYGLCVLNALGRVQSCFGSACS